MKTKRIRRNRNKSKKRGGAFNNRPLQLRRNKITQRREQGLTMAEILETIREEDPNYAIEKLERIRTKLECKINPNLNKCNPHLPPPPPRFSNLPPPPPIKLANLTLPQLLPQLLNNDNQQNPDSATTHQSITIYQGPKPPMTPVTPRSIKYKPIQEYESFHAAFKAGYMDGTDDYVNCKPMIISNLWPNFEGCDVETMIVQNLNIGQKVDRIGYDTGGYLAIMNETPDTYMKRAMKDYSPTWPCYKQYNNMIDKGQFNYHQYQVLKQTPVLMCTAVKPSWIDEMHKGRLITDSDLSLYTGATQCIFLIEDDGKDREFMDRYGTIRDETFYNNILSERPQRVLLDRPFRRFIKDTVDPQPRKEGFPIIPDPTIKIDGDPAADFPNKDTSTLHMYTHSPTDKSYMVFTVRGLLDAGIIKEIPVTKYPEFIDDPDKNLRGNPARILP